MDDLQSFNDQITRHHLTVFGIAHKNGYVFNVITLLSISIIGITLISSNHKITQFIFMIFNLLGYLQLQIAII